MKLRRFQRSKKRKLGLILIGILLVGTSLIIGSTYAVYQRQTEVRFINAKVRFPKSSEITYTTTSNSNVKNVEQALNDLYGKLGK